MVVSVQISLKISVRSAPMALRMPITFCLSITDIRILLMTPITEIRIAIRAMENTRTWAVETKVIMVIFTWVRLKT